MNIKMPPKTWPCRSLYSVHSFFPARLSVPCPTSAVRREMVCEDGRRSQGAWEYVHLFGYLAGLMPVFRQQIRVH